MTDACDALLSDGIFYPPSKNGHRLLLNCRLPGWRKSLSSAREQALLADSHTLLLSSESVATLSADHMAQLIRELASDEVTLLFCLRHWHSYWPSRWSQYSRRRDSQTFNAYVGSLLVHPDMDYAGILERARAARPAQVLSVNYEQAQATGGVVPALLKVAGISTLVPSSTQHARTPWQMTEACRLLNGILADHRRWPQDEMCRAAGEHRSPDRLFDLFARWSQLQIATASALDSAVERDRVEIEISKLSPELQAANDALGPLGFSETPVCRLMTTALTWQAFAAKHSALASEALSQLLA